MITSADMAYCHWRDGISFLQESVDG